MSFVPHRLQQTTAHWRAAREERRWPLWVGAWGAVVSALALWTGLFMLGGALWRGLFG